MTNFNGKDYCMYPDSKHKAGGAVLYIDRVGGVKSLIAAGSGQVYDSLEEEAEEIGGKPAKVCALNRRNAEAVRGAFPFTRPVSHAEHGVTIGLGDRLGLVSPGHLRAVKGLNVFLVLAQQSMRELARLQTPLYLRLS